MGKNNNIQIRFTDWVINRLKSSLKSAKILNPESHSATVEFKLNETLVALGATQVHLKLVCRDADVLLLADVFEDDFYFQTNFKPIEQIEIDRDVLVDSINIDEAICVATIQIKDEHEDCSCMWNQLYSSEQEVLLSNLIKEKGDLSSRILEEIHKKDKALLEARSKADAIQAYSFMFLFFSSILLFGMIISGEHIPVLLGIVILLGDLWSLHNFGVI